MSKIYDSLGIPNYGPWYLETRENQDSSLEMFKINNFIKKIMRVGIPEFANKTKTVQFINYGSTQVVFVVTINEEERYTFVINQPAIPFGTGKKEYDNLKLLYEKNKDVVIEPLWYFHDNDREAYVTPYHYKARCIGIDEDKWGMWVPEPSYHFVEYTDEERSLINPSMVANIVRLYDEETECGLSKITLDGGDFMLEYGFEELELNYDNILNNMKLIAARELIEMDFADYIDRLRLELSGNLEENKKMYILSKKLASPMTMEEIETGIELGLMLRDEKRYN